MSEEKLFRFNPFRIKEWTNEEVTEQYTILEESLMLGDTPVELAHDIDVYANLGYLMGEMIARYYETCSNLESRLKVDVANHIYRSRNQWLKQNADKAPAMSYFENEANSMFLNEQMELVKTEANLKRFKYAYDSIESKQNALKKKMESLRYDTLSR